MAKITDLTSYTEPIDTDLMIIEDVTAAVTKNISIADLFAAFNLPSGVMLEYGGGTAPDGWLLCYGQAIDRVTYADLYAVIGTAYGVGDGSTTFNVPDFRGRVAAGQDDMGGSSANRLTNTPTGGVDGSALGNSGGSQSHTLTTAQLASHTHSGSTSSGGSHSHTISGNVFTSGGSTNTTANVSGYQGITWGTDSTSSNGSHSHSFTTGSSGSGSAHNNVQPTLIVNKIIKI